MLALLLLLFSPAFAASQTPDNQLPPGIVGELKRLENRFELTLGQDCAPEKCFARGCTYGAHVVVDKPKQSGLPGLGDDKGPGSAPAQEYLTQARCEFAGETTIAARDLSLLVKRLEQKLSSGYLTVTVEAKQLPTLPSSLRQTPIPATTPFAAPTPAGINTSIPEKSWDAGIAVRELWVALLPHFSWMIAMLLLTIAALILIWALRRLGRESWEEKAMLASLEKGAVPETPASPSAPEEPKERPKPEPESALEIEYAGNQASFWKEKLDADPHALDAIATEWLRMQEFGLLGKAMFVFGERFTPPGGKEGSLAPKKLQFAQWLAAPPRDALPTESHFYRRLAEQYAASRWLSHSDVKVVLALREDFGAAGIVRLMQSLNGRLSALLFAFLPTDVQRESAVLLDKDKCRALVQEFLRTNRASDGELESLFSFVRAATDGKPVHNIRIEEASALEYGREIPATQALSVLIPQLPPQERKELVALAVKTGRLPRWIEETFYPEMLFKITSETRAELLLNIELRDLSALLQSLGTRDRATLMAELPQSMQNAVRSVPSFQDRVGLAHGAERALAGLSNALQRRYASGEIRFVELV